MNQNDDGGKKKNDGCAIAVFVGLIIGVLEIWSLSNRTVGFILWVFFALILLVLFIISLATWRGY